MNQGRIWTVVKPTVGLPLFLGSVAVTSLIVHYAVLSHTTWMAAYWEGGHKAKVSQETPAPAASDATKLSLQDGRATVALDADSAAKPGAGKVAAIDPKPTQ
jgi:light-harvesting protein B-800-850 alpha chain